MIKKLLFILFFSLLAVPALAQKHEAMYDISKAYDYSCERKTEEAFKYAKLFETYLDKHLSPASSSDSIAIYYTKTIGNLMLFETSHKESKGQYSWEMYQKHVLQKT